MASNAVAVLTALLDPMSVQSQLLGRNPDLFTSPSTPDRAAAFGRLTSGVATEIVDAIGDPPWDLSLQDKASWCLAVGVAYKVESSLFPEQQIGEGSRGDQLRIEYLRLLKALRMRSVSNMGPSYGGFDSGFPGDPFSYQPQVFYITGPSVPTEPSPPGGYSGTY